MAKRLIYSDVNPKLEIGLDYYRENNNLLYVVPYYQMKETLREKLINGKKIVETKNIISIDKLFKKLYYKAVGKYKIVSDMDLKFYLYQLLKEEKNKFFNQKSVDYIIEFINQVDAGLVDLDEEIIEDEILEELKMIYYTLKDKLESKGLITKWQAYQLLLNQITESDFRYLHGEVESIFLDRLHIIRPLELELILKLSSWVDEITILLDYHPDKKKLYSNLDSIVNRLKAEGFVEDKRVEKENLLLKGLFSNGIKNDGKKYNWQDQMNSKLELSALSSPVAELELIAKKILDLASKGENLSKVALAFSTPHRYLPHLDRILAQYNLPYKETIPLSLLSSSLIQDIDGILNLLTANFSKDELLTVASSSFIELDYQGSLLDRLTELLRKVRFEAKGWKLLELIEAKTDNEELLGTLSLIRDKFKWNLNQRLSFDDFMDKFSSLLNQLKLKKRLKEMDDPGLEAAWQGFKDGITTLNNLELEQRKVKEWIELLQLAIEEGSYKLKHGKGIEVTGKIELRSGDYDYIFLAGMSHDLYPIRRKNPLSKYFDSLGLELEDKQISDRYLFFDHLLAANKGVFITYSKAENEEKPLASSCITELGRTVKLDEIKIEDKLYSVKELQQKFGERLSNGELFNLKDDYSWREDLGLKFRLQKDRDAQGLEAYNGHLQDKENIKWLNDKFDKDYNYSASLLESYYQCPFQFLFNRLFKIDSRELNEEMDHLERGNFVHRVLERFYKEFSAGRVTEKNYDTAYRTLMEATKKVIEENQNFKDNFYWLNEGERYLKEDGLGTILEQFLDAEMNSKIARWGKTKGCEIKEVEYRFSDLELIAGYLFRAKIDRINYHRDLDIYGVVDYKSGRVTKKNIGNSPLQLPLYILAAQKELNVEIDFGSYYGLRPDDRVGYKTVLKNDNLYKGNDSKRTEKFNNLLEDTKDRVIELIENLKQGNFNLGEEGSCDYCQAKFICRKEEL